MKKLSLVIFVAVVSIAFVACGDSKDSQVESNANSHESQSIDSNDSQVESSDLSQDSNQSTGESNNKSTQDSREVTETLSDDYAKRVLDEIKKYMSFIVSPEGFSALDALTYDSAKVQVDKNNDLEFIDLCKHRIVDGVKYQGIFQGETYDSNCIVSDTQGEIDRIRKYFIKAKSIDEAFGLYYKTKDKAPKGNVYKDDGVSIYYIWENGRLWISSSGHNGGSVTIFTQKGDFVEVIYRWSFTG